MNLNSLRAPAGALTLLTSASLAQEVIFSDDFDDNTITGWTFFDRHGAEEIANANWVETSGRLEQQTANYDFPRDTEDDPVLGTIALAPQKVSGHYQITTTFISLEPGNGFQDEDIVFGYVDDQTFFFLETIPSGLNLFQVVEGNRMRVTGGTLSFLHDPVVVTLEHNSETGAVIVTYGDELSQEFIDPIFIREEEVSVGVGSNNDAFAIDDFTITSTTPIAPTTLEITSVARDSTTGEATIIWTSQAGADYFVDRSTDLVNWLEIDDALGEAGTTSLVDSTSPEAGAFYRVRTE